MKKEKIMRYSKIVSIAVLILIVGFQTLSAKYITVKDLNEPKLTEQDINKMNELYSGKLVDCNINFRDVLMMNILKQKIIYPQSDFDCLLNPLKTIVNNSDDERIISLALITHHVLVSDLKMKIDKDNLYTRNVDAFFNYIIYQMPKMLAHSSL